jgi:hypothetical protein
MLVRIALLGSCRRSPAVPPRSCLCRPGRRRFRSSSAASRRTQAFYPVCVSGERPFPLDVSVPWISARRIVSARPALSSRLFCPRSLTTLARSCEVEREWSGILGVAGKEGRAAALPCPGPGGRRRTTLPVWLPSCASRVGNRSGYSCSSRSWGRWRVRSCQSVRTSASQASSSAKGWRRRR